MNQDNNFNQNNFNYQGNNGISNNQPLNNQSFNQGMNVNQQLTPNFQQPIVQEPIPQPTNTFESGNAGNQSFNSKSSKKMNLGLIIGIVSTVAVVAVGIVFGSKLFLNKDNIDNNNNNNTNVVNNIKNGTSKLVYTSKNKIHRFEDINAYRYFETQDNNGNTVILDNNGSEILRLNGYYQYIHIDNNEGIILKKKNYQYLGDNYIIYNDVIDGSFSSNVFDLQKKKVLLTYKSYVITKQLYKEDVLYYYDVEQSELVAYDLQKSKELWRYERANDDGVIFGNYIFFESGNYSSCGLDGIDNRNCYASEVLDLDGNVIIEGNTDKIEYTYSLDKDNLIHTYVMNDKYYLKVKFQKYIEVYDFNHKLISTLSLETNGNTDYSLMQVFEEGLFTVWEYDENYFGKYVLYDVNKNIVLESDSMIDEVGINTSDVLVLGSDKYYIIKDGKVVEKFDDYHKAKVLALTTGYENSYLLIENNDTVNSIYTKQYMNLKTLEKFDVPLENVTESIEESPTGNYIILSTGNDFYVYDSKFNLKYESTNLLDPINDKYVFEYTLGGNKISIVNVENGKKNEVEIKGKFQTTEFSSGGFVTSDGTNYYLYGFN